jgi:hypothetical protein
MNRGSQLWKWWIPKNIVNQPKDHSYKNNTKDEEHAGVWGLNIHQLNPPLARYSGGKAKSLFKREFAHREQDS